MTATERVTGTRDENYNLISVLYHTLQEVETLQQYIDDAKQAGDDDAAELFHKLQDDDQQCAGQVKKLLADRLRKAVS